MRAVSLFSSAGIAETFFEDLGIEVAASNELIDKRANLYSNLYPDTHVIPGDIQEKRVFDQIKEAADGKIDLVLASPPCQGMSMAGKGRNVENMLKDERNFLFYDAIKFIKAKNPEFAVIENVPNLLKLKLPYKGFLKTVTDILFLEFGNDYEIEAEILDAVDFGVPQNRPRAIIKLYKKGNTWEWPTTTNESITVRDAIAHLPSLKAGEKSKIKWHFAREHVERHIRWMKHTPTGKSAFDNEIHFPQKKDGTRIKGYNTTYRRIRWDQPAPTITMRNDAISSQRNVHPGRKNEDGTYSDARVLTPLELMILTSLPEDWNLPDDTPERLIRQCIGESIPPLLVKEILKTI